MRLGSREAAEDATSEVFMKAMTGLAGFRGGVFAGWLFRIAANVVTDAHRRGRNRHWSLPLHLELADPMQQEQLDDVGISLHAALRTLPDDEQVTLELQLAGWTSDEIGAVLDRSPSAIRMTRARALRRLRASLAESGTELDPGASPW